MAKKKKPAEAASAAPAPRVYCAVPKTVPRTFGPDVHPTRASLLIVRESRWLRTDRLTFGFFDNDPTWGGTEEHKQLVRDAFDLWKGLGLLLTFQEVAAAAQAKIRIGFMADDGHWSFIGREIDNKLKNERTMNLDSMDPNLLGPTGIDTALHEIGHTLGFPHEHQNPKAGIEWNRNAVIDFFRQDPNNWPPEQTEFNILRQINPKEVDGSDWDKDSIMHYRFEAGLIDVPQVYQTKPLIPRGGLSERDKKLAKAWYAVKPEEEEVELLKSNQLNIKPEEEKYFFFTPTETREYRMQTFGEADTEMDLSQESNGQWEELAKDNDSGLDKNAMLRQQLLAGQHYRIRIRLNFAERPEGVSFILG